jgi:DNA polymerase-3 subunit delta
MPDQSTPTFYLLYGDDDLARDAALAKYRANMGAGADLNLSEFDGENVSVPQVLNAVSSYPFLAEQRMVIVKGLIAHLNRKGGGESAKKDLERLLEDLPKLPAYARLILVESEAPRKDSKIVKLATEKGYCKAFEAPKDSSEWILKRAKTEYQADIDRTAAEALASVVGNDLRRADHELVKLVCYVNGERAITEADVALLTPYRSEANVFELIDAVAAGQARTALQLVNRTLEQDPSDPGFGLFALITTQFRRLLLVREHLDSGGSADKNAIAELLSIKPYPAEKLARQSRQFRLADLERIYRRLHKYDYDMKLGRIKPRMALDLFIASLSRS